MTWQTLQINGANVARPGTALCRRNRILGSTIPLACLPGGSMFNVIKYPHGGRTP